MELQLEDLGVKRFGAMQRGIRKRKLAAQKNKNFARRKIYYNRKTGTAYTLCESDLSAAPLIVGAISAAKKAIQSPGGQKIISKIFGGKGGAKVTQATTSALQVPSDYAIKLQAAQEAVQQAVTKAAQLEAERNSMAQQRYYYGGGGFVAGVLAGKFLFK